MTAADQTTPSGYVTTAQIAAELGVHEHTAQKYFREGGLPGRKIGKHWMTTRAALDAWLTATPHPTDLEGTGPAVTLEHKELP